MIDWAPHEIEEILGANFVALDCEPKLSFMKKYEITGFLRF